ncbi:MAG: lamin tail domain-containing protein, partial [Pirellulales bacterium]|nr:lamin tail domain-containing protein [Pirellulales bacterium]
DDGAVFYLNGVEIYRHNMPAGPISFATMASTNVVSPVSTGRVTVPGGSLIVNGANVLAVEVHQGGGNTDVWFGASFFVIETAPLASALPGLVINEIDSAQSDTFFLEIYNRGDTGLDTSQFILRTLGAMEADYSLPSQTLIAGDYLVIDANQLNFVPATGDKVFLVQQDSQRVLDAREITGRLQGISLDYENQWLYPDAASPGQRNVFSFQDDIVINEIFYHAPPQFARPGTLVVDTLVAIDDSWRYNQTGDDLGALWQRMAHPVDGSDWLSGPALLAYESSSLGEPIRTALTNPQANHPFVVTYYFENDFEFPGDPDNPDLDLQLRHWIDDGAIFYLNGNEIYRYNLSDGQVSAGTFSETAIGNAVSVGPVSVPKDSLVHGMNRLSVEVHQSSSSSTDIVFGAELTVSEQVGSTPFEEVSEEWIELYHRGDTPMDLSGWRMEGGVDFEFPDGTVLAPEEYLVLAADAELLLQQYPGIHVLGGLEGRLSNHDDLIRLVDGAGNPADEVHYYESGRWPTLADGSGASLELRDAFADNSKGETWSASAIAPAPWQTVTYRGFADEPPGSNNPDVWHEWILGLLDSGEILVDDISVIEDPDGAAIERIQNGSFESGLDAWRLVGNHGQHGLSGVIPEPGNGSNNVLHVVATGATEHMSNHVETTFAGGASIIDGREYLISMRVRWLSGSPQLHTRLYFNRLARTTILETIDQYGTPGAINSTIATNIGPTYDAFAHSPPVPRIAEPVTVRVRATDADGVAGVVLKYSVNGGPFISATMSVSGDGLYQATIPGQNGGDVVQFYVEGTDSLGAVSRFPAAGEESRALYQVDNNSVPDGPQHGFHLFMTAADYDWLVDPVNVMSDHRMGATVVFNNQQVYYDVAVRLKGSGFSRGTAATGFNLQFPADSLLFGVHDVVSIDRQGGPWGIGASHRELTLKHIGNRAGDIPMMYDDALYLVAPDSGLDGTCQLLVGGYGDVFLDSQYESGGDGTLFKFELVYYSTQTETGSSEAFKLPPRFFAAGIFPVLGVDIRDMGDDQNAYRWNYLISNNRAGDDYSRIIDMGKAFSLTGSMVGGALDLATRAVIDVDQWMRLFAFESLVGINDTYNQGLPHNLQFYVRPSDNRVLAFPWDMDHSFHRSTSASIYGENSELSKVISIPSNRRLFQGHLYDIMSTTFNLDYLTPWIDHIATRAEQDNSSAIMDYVSARRAFVLGKLMPQVAFSITTNHGADFTVDDQSVVLVGDGWINVREIRLAGSSGPLAVTWIDDNSWQVTMPLVQGANPIEIQAYGFQGDLLATDTINVTSTASNPVVESLRLTEINYNPAEPTTSELAMLPGLDNNDFEFLEFVNSGTVPIHLMGVSITDGVSFTFPDVELAAGQHAVVVQDIAAFELRYGTKITILGEFSSGKLDNDGERIVVVAGNGGVIHDFGYDDEAGWPTGPDGNGPTLTVIDIRGDYNDSANWRASTADLGTPGMHEPIPADFNSDGDVDRDDLLIWQGGFGIRTGAAQSQGDADGDGDVDGNDFLSWQQFHSGHPSPGVAANRGAGVEADNVGGGDVGYTTAGRVANFSDRSVSRPINPVRIRTRGQEIPDQPANLRGLPFESMGLGTWLSPRPTPDRTEWTADWFHLRRFQSLRAAQQIQWIRHELAVDTVMAQLSIFYEKDA